MNEVFALIVLDRQIFATGFGLLLIGSIYRKANQIAGEIARAREYLPKTIRSALQNVGVNLVRRQLSGVQTFFRHHAMALGAASPILQTTLHVSMTVSHSELSKWSYNFGR